MIVYRMSDTIGNTPLLCLLKRTDGVRLLVKLEQANPLGTAKVRMARSMIDAAERAGLLREGGHIVESTSGNTGLGLAMIAAERGYQFTAVVDGHSARDKVDTMRALGATIVTVTTDGNNHLATDLRDKRAQEICAADPTAFWTAQHDNPANADGYTELASELVADLGTDINMLVGAVGTGGSLCGTARALRNQGVTPRIVGVEPRGSVIFGGPASSYLQSGTGTPHGAAIGAVVDYALLHSHRKVSDAEAFAAARWLTRRFAVHFGGSAGAVLYTAALLSERAPANSTIVALACDGGERYLKTVYNDAWMSEHGLSEPRIATELTRAFEPTRFDTPRTTPTVRSGALSRRGCDAER
ncbi:MAG: cysteine synthase family protein [Clostridia bacterium]|nr:cysteine synthase family protein [Deltaproteobacteria bacterium]